MTPFTKILDSPEDIASRARQVIETSEHLFSCSELGGLKMIENVAYDSIKKVLEKSQEGKHMGVRWIGTIKSKDNINVVRRFLALGMEIKHLESTPLNFSVTDKEFNFTVSSMQGGSIAPSVLVSNEQPYIKQFNSLFEQLWSQGTDATDRIREIEEGIETPKIEVIINPYKTLRQFLDLTYSANEEVLLIVPTVNAFRRGENIGIVQALCNIAVKKDVKVMLLSPFNAKVKQEITQLQEKGLIIQANQKSSRCMFILLIVDKRYSLVIEVKDDSTNDFHESIGMATFSNSKATVNPLVAVFEILWSQAELYEQIRVANEKLVLRDKMQEEFINVAAHELRTPIQPILGLVELLGSQFSEEGGETNNKGEIMKEEFAILSRNAKRLERLSSNILEVTRIESGMLYLDIQEFDLNNVLSLIIEDARDEVKTRGRADDVKILYSLLDDDSMAVRGDKDRILEVLWNLLDNALKFTERGEISIETRKYDNNYVIVRVQDSGSGIDSEVLQKLFTKFVTKSYKGTGLGLFICKRIIEAHRGKIWAENNKDRKGAAFTFTLPLAV